MSTGGSARSLRTLAVFAALAMTPSLASAEGLSIGSGSTFSLGSGTLDLGCGDLGVNGSFNANSGTVNEVRDVTIAGGGVLNGGSGALNVTRNWSNGGSFTPETSVVNLVDECSASHATISGSSSFDTLSVTSSVGKTVRVEAGSTQTIAILAETHLEQLSTLFIGAVLLRQSRGGH